MTGSGEGRAASREEPREAFPRDSRIRKRWEHREVARRGKRVHTPHYVFIVLPRPGAETRLGITVTKKVSPAAVSRNRVKRVLREVFRKNRSLFPSAADVVAVAKAGADTLGYAEARAEVVDASRALERASGRRG